MFLTWWTLDEMYTVVTKWLRSRTEWDVRGKYEVWKFGGLCRLYKDVKARKEGNNNFWRVFQNSNGNFNDFSVFVYENT